MAAGRAIARADGAVLVHCAAGKDRTGVVIALALVDERFGGAVVWRASHGLSEPDIERLRRRLAPARGG